MSKLQRKIQFAKQRGIRVANLKTPLNMKEKVIRHHKGFKFASSRPLHHVYRIRSGYDPKVTGNWWAVMIDGSIYPTVGYTKREAVAVAYALAKEHASVEDLDQFRVEYFKLEV